MRVPYAGPTYGAAEIEAVRAALMDPEHLVAGPKIEEFEARVSRLLGQQHGVMVNSGSSANLLALYAHGIPGETVLTPVLTGGWIVSPILHAGLTPVFCDVDPLRFIADVEDVKAGIEEHEPSVVLYPLLLGNLPPDGALDDLADVCLEREVKLIVDACDTLGYPPETTARADAVTTSFYATHIITAAGTGGMVAGPNALTSYVRVVSQWGRQSLVTGDSLEDRFRDGYDSKFVFASADAHNLQPMEAQAAFGCVQLDSLDDRARARRLHFMNLRVHLADSVPDALEMPEFHVEAVPLAFPVLVKPDSPLSRNELAIGLEERGIQTRPIMGGNILRQPGYRHLPGPRDFPGADRVTRDGLMVGCHQGMTGAQLAHVIDTMEDLLT